MDTLMQYAWLIPLFPLLAFIVIVSFGRQLKEGAAAVGILFTAVSFGLAVLTFWQRFQEGATDYKFSIDWLKVGDIVITMGFEINQLNALMLLIVTLVSLLVQIYSKGYMHGDERFPVFYQYLALFTFSMLGLVIAPNLLQIYIFWELVGVCSFLLVGYYYFKPEAKAAAKKHSSSHASAIWVFSSGSVCCSGGPAALNCHKSLTALRSENWSRG